MNSLQSEEHFEASMENQKYSNTSSTITHTNQELNSSSSSNIKNQLHIGIKQLNYPHHILQSVYERCNLNALKNPGYARLCGGFHFKKENNSKSLEHDNLTSGIRNYAFEGITSTSSYSNDAILHNNYKNSSMDVKQIYSSSSKNDKDLGKENLYIYLHSPRLEEESNILASLEKLDWKLATISGKILNNERSSLMSQGGELSSKLGQSAQAIRAHNSPSSTTLEKTNLIVRRFGNNYNMPSQPLSARMIPKKLPISHRQRQVVGMTNKNQGRSIHQLHRKSKNCIPSFHKILKEENKIGPSSPGSIVCYKDPHYILNPIPRVSGITI